MTALSASQVSENEDARYNKMSPSKSEVPYRQIRAVYDDETITIYQAYSEAIATAAVKEQKLYASPDFIFQRMTWIKPSWCWMMYRSGYALKDARQTHILALRMTRANFHALLSEAAVCRGKTPFTEPEKKLPVRVQWDPERNARIGVLEHRSIQIGIGRGVSQKWAENWIESIEDVTPMAVKLREEIGNWKGKDLDVEGLIAKGCLPREEVYELPEELRRHLRMEEVDES